jgi:hypothetical protein
MDTFNFEDNTTVVGGSSLTKYKPTESIDFPRSAQQVGNAKNRHGEHDFVTSSDYMLEERPYFVRIGKDGLIGALQRLDKQLQKVCTGSF